MFRKILLILLPTLLFISCGQNRQDEIKLKEFQKRYKELTEFTPEQINLKFIEMCENADESSAFSRYTPEMMERQFSTNYRLASEDLSKLIIDILVYKKVIGNKNITPEKLKNVVVGLNQKENGFNAIVVNSFNLLVEYKSKELELNLY
jgi:hypothetical protein